MTTLPHEGVPGRLPAPPPAGGLPLSYTPICATYAPGPFLDEQVVAPSDVRWMNARTYVVRDGFTKQDFRALRILDTAGHFVGYWAIELLAKPLYLGIEFESDRQDSIEEYEAQQLQDARDAKRKKLRGGRPNELG